MKKRKCANVTPFIFMDKDFEPLNVSFHFDWNVFGKSRHRDKIYVQLYADVELNINFDSICRFRSNATYPT